MLPSQLSSHKTVLWSGHHQLRGRLGFALMRPMMMAVLPSPAWSATISRIGLLTLASARQPRRGCVASAIFCSTNVQDPGEGLLLLWAELEGFKFLGLCSIDSIHHTFKGLSGLTPVIKILLFILVSKPSMASLSLRTIAS